MEEKLKVRLVGREVIIFTEKPYYREIVVKTDSSLKAESVARRLVYCFGDINNDIR